MAFFPFRLPGFGARGDAASSARSGSADSADTLRRRARHRLVGAAVLVALAVLGFPLLFDTQPRPVPVDIPIVIPDRDKVAPLALPPEVRAAAPAAEPPAMPAAAPSSRVADASSLGAGEEVVGIKKESKVPVASAPPAKPAIKTEVPAKAEAKAEAKLETKPARPEARSDDAARAQALLEGKPLPEKPVAQDKPEKSEKAEAADKLPAEGRFIVQVGAFAEPTKVQEVRQKAERTGLKTYVQTVDTKDGKRTRVRVGPFASRAEAEAAAARLKGADLPASLLAL